MSSAPIPASRIDDLAMVYFLRDRPPQQPMRERLHKEIGRGMDLALPLDQVPEQLAVFIDQKARVAAYGWPHGEHFTVIERMSNGFVKVHQIQGPIVRRGMWQLCSVIAVMNNDNSWGKEMEGGDTMSVAGMLQTLQDFERRMRD